MGKMGMQALGPSKEDGVEEDAASEARRKAGRGKENGEKEHMGMGTQTSGPSKGKWWGCNWQVERIYSARNKNKAGMERSRKTGNGEEKVEDKSGEQETGRG